MSQSSHGSDGSDGSDGRGRSRSRSRTQSPRPQDSTVTLAKIFMIEGNGPAIDWDGKDPKNKRLFVYVTIGDTTYRGYFTKKKDSNCMRPGPYEPRKLQGTSFLHCGNGSILLPLMQGRPNFNIPKPYYCRIYKDNYTDTFWYKMDFGDTEVSNNVFISRHNKIDIPIDSIRHIHQSNVGDPCSIGRNYTHFCDYHPGECLYVLKREIEGRSISEQPSKRQRTGGGGKTRRKCKVKKRRNRRRRNTMKRRKTTAKLRYR